MLLLLIFKKINTKKLMGSDELNSTKKAFI
jgi:hypothetical protein